MHPWYAYTSHEDSSWWYGLAVVALQSATASPVVLPLQSLHPVSRLHTSSYLELT